MAFVDSQQFEIGHAYQTKRQRRSIDQEGIGLGRYRYETVHARVFEELYHEHNKLDHLVVSPRYSMFCM